MEVICFRNRRTERKRKSIGLLDLSRIRNKYNNQVDFREINKRQNISLNPLTINRLIFKQLRTHLLSSYK